MKVLYLFVFYSITIDLARAYVKYFAGLRAWCTLRNPESSVWFSASFGAQRVTVEWRLTSQEFVSRSSPHSLFLGYF